MRQYPKRLCSARSYPWLSKRSVCRRKPRGHPQDTPRVHRVQRRNTSGSIRIEKRCLRPRLMGSSVALRFVEMLLEKCQEAERFQKLGSSQTKVFKQNFRDRSQAYRFELTECRQHEGANLENSGLALREKKKPRLARSN